MDSNMNDITDLEKEIEHKEDRIARGIAYDFDKSSIGWNAELRVLKRWLAYMKELEKAVDETEHYVKELNVANKKIEELEAELEKQANWIADNHRLISTLNEDRDNNLDKIKDLEAELGKVLKDMAKLEAENAKLKKSSLTKEEAEGMINKKGKTLAEEYISDFLIEAFKRKEGKA